MVSEHHTPAMTFDEFPVVIPFQSRNPLAHRRLRDLQDRARLHHRTGLGQGHEGFQIFDHEFLLSKLATIIFLIFAFFMD